MAEPVYGTCLVCGDLFRTKKSDLERRKTCSRKCSDIRKKTQYKGESNPNYGNRGQKNPVFVGEKIKLGYRLVYMPGHPNSQKDGYILEHRLIMSEVLGRPLEDFEDVHHKDENRLNNDPSNLEVITRSEHTALHNRQKQIVRDENGRIKAIIKAEG